MKKFLPISVLGTALVAVACTDRDVITRNLDALPAPAHAILRQQFAQTQVSYIKIDKIWFWQTDYDVQLVNGMEISFDQDGDWTEVDGKRSEVPPYFIPAEIRSQVESMFPGEKVTQIEKSRRKYEIELSNDVELEFDRDFNIKEID